MPRRQTPRKAKRSGESRKSAAYTLALPLGELAAFSRLRGAGMPPRAIRYGLHPTNGWPARPRTACRIFVGDDAHIVPQSKCHDGWQTGYPLRRLNAASSPRGGAKGAAAPGGETPPLRWMSKAVTNRESPMVYRHLPAFQSRIVSGDPSPNLETPMVPENGKAHIFQRKIRESHESRALPEMIRFVLSRIILPQMPRWIAS